MLHGMEPTAASHPATFALGGTTTIPRLGFGAMQLPGRRGGPEADRATSVAVARRAVELGATHIDTAGFYFRGGNRANDILREALHPYPAGVTIATKIGPLRRAERRDVRRGGARAAAVPGGAETCRISA
jgi:aryl-alcohol dehydrogenase-like predicted oxidoreductase